MPIDRSALDKARGAVFLRKLAPGDRLPFWFTPSNKAGAPVLIVEKDPGRLAPKAARERRAAADRDQVFEGWVRLDGQALLFEGEGEVEPDAVQSGLAALAGDRDWGSAASLLAASQVAVGDGAPHDEDEDEGPAEAAANEQISDADWEAIKLQSKQAYTTITGVLDKSSVDWGELQDLQKQAVQAKRAGDLAGSVGFFRKFLNKAEAVLKREGAPPTMEQWAAARARAQTAYTALSKVQSAGDAEFEVIDTKRRTAVELRKRGDLAASIKLFDELVANVNQVLGR